MTKYRAICLIMNDCACRAHRVCPSEVRFNEPSHQGAVFDLGELKICPIAALFPFCVRHKALQLPSHALWEGPIQAGHSFREHLRADWASYYGSPLGTIAFTCALTKLLMSLATLLS